MLLWLMTNSYLITPYQWLWLYWAEEESLKSRLVLHWGGASFPFAVAATVEALYFSNKHPKVADEDSDDDDNT